MRNQTRSLVWLAALGAVVGCQTNAVQGPGEKVLQPQVPAGAAQPAAAQPAAEAGKVQAVSSQVASPDLILNARPMSMKAAEGGVYVSTDGKLQAQFPPGALSQDAEVRLIAVDTAKEPVGGRIVPGIRFQVDLGGASLQPGTQATVVSRVDDRFVENIKKDDPNFTPEKYNLVSDGKGGYGLRMAVHGPAVRQQEQPEGPAAGFLEEGGFTNFPTQTLGAGLAALGGRQAIETYCVYVRCWDGTVRAIDHSGPCPEPPPPVPVIADIKWSSDDVSVDGKPAQGAIASFAVYDARAVVGPTSDIVAGANGQASTTVRQGFRVGVRTYTNQPVPMAGNSGEGTAGFTHSSTIVLNSPEITLNLDTAGDAVLGQEAEIGYRLNGVEGTLRSGAAPAGTSFRASFQRLSDTRASMTFRLPVPGNLRNYSFALSSLTSGGSIAHPNAVESVRGNLFRNGRFTYAVKMIGNAGK